MPVVFVHGNPECTAIWDTLLPHLGRTDVVALAPPGFGAPVPAGFGATADEYLAWLAAELARLEAPVDLVGHDWGGIHAMRIAMEHPQLVRSWVTDAAVFDAQYTWHDMARVWQAAGAGEEAVAALAALPVEARTRRYESFGIDEAVARELAAAFDTSMGRCLLALYRSAAQPALAQWGRRLGDAAARPGLVVVATEDRFVGGETLQRRSAAASGARAAVLQGAGHWWMCEDAQRAARILEGFWSAVGACAR